MTKKTIKIKRSNVELTANEDMILRPNANKMKESSNSDLDSGKSIIKLLRYTILYDGKKPLLSNFVSLSVK